jgi:hypothetical protein
MFKFMCLFRNDDAKNPPHTIEAHRIEDAANEWFKDFEEMHMEEAKRNGWEVTLRQGHLEASHTVTNAELDVYEIK